MKVLSEIESGLKSEKFQSKTKKGIRASFALNFCCCFSKIATKNKNTTWTSCPKATTIPILTMTQSPADRKEARNNNADSNDDDCNNNNSSDDGNNRNNNNNNDDNNNNSNDDSNDDGNNNNNDDNNK